MCVGDDPPTQRSVWVCVQECEHVVCVCACVHVVCVGVREYTRAAWVLHSVCARVMLPGVRVRVCVCASQHPNPPSSHLKFKTLTPENCPKTKSKHLEWTGAELPFRSIPCRSPKCTAQKKTCPNLKNTRTTSKLLNNILTGTKRSVRRTPEFLFAEMCSFFSEIMWVLLGSDKTPGT